MHGTRLITFSKFCALGLVLSACQSKTRPPAYRGDPEGGGGGSTGISLGSGAAGGSESTLAPPEDLSNFCGNLVLPIQLERPNLYLVLDRSGSMNDPMGPNAVWNAPNKYFSSVNALHDVLFAVGHRTNYGAALFPAWGNTQSCRAGDSIDPVSPGDSVTYARSKLDGPHLTGLMKDLRAIAPEGATPTSATFEKLMPMLLALEGETSVILTTDGAPNCNQAAVCTASGCIANIEGAYQVNGSVCSATVNCCAPTADYGPTSCVDEAATVAHISRLLAAGIKTYVIGLPGTEAYVPVMNHLAEAGGTARATAQSSEPKYYRVEDAEALAQSLKTIVASLAISCEVALDEAPPDWNRVNVYFDNGLVLMNENGWQKVDDTHLRLVGTSCEVLKSGDVFQVQVVAGCETKVIQ